MTSLASAVLDVSNTEVVKQLLSVLTNSTVWRRIDALVNYKKSEFQFNKFCCFDQKTTTGIVRLFETKQIKSNFISLTIR